MVTGGTIQERLFQALELAISKRTDKEHIESLKYLKSEFQRVGKQLSDADAIAVLRRCVKGERELLKAQGKEASCFLAAALMFLPEMATEREIADWVINQFPNVHDAPNKNIFMRDIMKHFGTRADGAVVKKVLMSL